MFSIIVSVSLFGMICSSQSQTQGGMMTFLDIENYDHCEGKDAANYTIIDTYNLDSSCNVPPNDNDVQPNLIYYSPNGQKMVNSLVQLSWSRTPTGAIDDLYLVSSGNLQGKFIYTKEVLSESDNQQVMNSGLSEAYLKKCSSVLGVSYITSKMIMLIADKLDLNVFLNPGGVYEPFKRSASTICTGISTVF